MNTNSVLPWIEKYRPATIDEIISHDQIVPILKIFVEKKCMPHLLFYGPPGTGKTSAIVACAKELYKEHYPVMVLEINASEDRGIDVVRTRIHQFVTAKNIFYGEDYKNIFKLVILDEADAMTDDAQAILRKVIEKHTENARFCLICNYVKKINPALQSRCTSFRFAPLNDEQIKIKMLDIIKKEEINITDTGIDTIIKRSNGDMRKILNILQSTSMAYDDIDKDVINSCLGYPRADQVDEIIKYLTKKTFSESFKLIQKYRMNHGYTLSDILNEIHTVLINCVLIDDDQRFDKYDNDQIIQILSRLSNIEYNLSVCTNETLQIGAFIGIFKC